MADQLYKCNGIDLTKRHYKLTEDLRSYRVDKVGSTWVDTQLYQPEHMITNNVAYIEYTIPSSKE
jgi:hypothetical protein